MSIQGLMQKGMVNRSCLEKTADVLLAFPRKVWLNREVVIKVKGTESNVSIKKSNSLSKNITDGEQGIGLGLVSIIASPFLAVGLILKKIAISLDPMAKNYHRLVEYHLKITKSKEQDIQLNTKLRTTNASLEILNSISLPDGMKHGSNTGIDHWGNFTIYYPLQNKTHDLMKEKDKLERKLGQSNELQTKIQKLIEKRTEKLRELITEEKLLKKAKG